MQSCIPSALIHERGAIIAVVTDAETQDLSKLHGFGACSKEAG